MEIGILLTLTILILFFSIYQQKTFRRTKQHFNRLKNGSEINCSNHYRSKPLYHPSIISQNGGKTTRGYIGMYRVGSAKHVNSHST